MSEKNYMTHPLVIICGTIGILLFFLLTYPLWPSCAPSAQSRRLSSTSNLLQISLALHQYAIDSDNFFPNATGAAGLKILVDTGYLTDYSTYIMPIDHQVQIPTADTFLEPNIHYAYLGSGLQNQLPQLAEKIPLAFEKPWIDKKRIAVVYMDGHVQSFEKVKFKTCIKVVEFCRKNCDLYGSDRIWQTLLENAKSVDIFSLPEVKP